MQEKLGKQTHEAEEKLSKLSLAGDETGQPKSDQKGERELLKNTETERPHEAVEEEVVTVRPLQVVTEEEMRSSTTAVGELCETVGESVIGIVKTAKDMAVGQEPEE